LTAVSDPAEVDGVFGKAADFDGDDAYYTAHHADFSPDAFTIGMWIKTSSANDAILFGKYGGDYKEYYFRMLGTGRLYFYVGGGSSTDVGAISTSISVNDGNWHFIVATYNGTNIAKIYIDGKLNVTGTNFYTIQHNTTNVYIARASWYPGLNLTGYLDDIFFVNRVLSSTDISNLYGTYPTSATNTLTNYRGRKRTTGAVSV
jgi:hypothetical protein